MAQEEVPESVPPTLPSGLVVPFPVPPALARIRGRWDHAALTGARPHVTILYPFLPCPELGLPVRAELTAIARRIQVFEVRFERVRRFPGLIWIEPEPAEPFSALTAAVAERWPDHPPYGGIFDTVIPHLTVVESETAPIDEIENMARAVVPFSSRCSPHARRRRSRISPLRPGRSDVLMDRKARCDAS